MTIPIKIICASLNFQRLDDKALENLSNANLENNQLMISKFKKEVGFNIEQLAIINKCNAVIIVFCYYDNLSDDFIRGRILNTWDKFSKGGISNLVKYIKFFDNNDALKYLGECATGLHSVTLGDSQVLSQIYEPLQDSAQTQNNNPTFSIISLWLKELVSEVKLRTQIFTGNTSLERISTEIIKNRFSVTEGVSIIGFGKSGKLIYKILHKELGYHIAITNRTINLLSEIEGQDRVKIFELNDYKSLLQNSCIIIAIDSNKQTKKYISGLFLYIKNNNSKPKLIIDLSSPPLTNKVSGFDIINIENLSTEANKNINKRSSETVKVRAIINKSCESVREKLKEELGKMSLDQQKQKVTCKLDDKMLELFQIRNNTYRSIRKYLEKLYFTEVTTPYIVGVSTDPPKVDKGGAINIHWPSGSQAFLRQSNQIYKQMIVASGLPKIYELGPFWRAETIQSYRHLQESIGLDVEFSHPKNLEQIYSVAYSIILKVKEDIWKTHKIKNKDFILPELDSVPVITYKEGVEMLNTKGYSISFGEDLGLMGEAKLGQIIKREFSSDAFIIKDYPDTIKKFYTKKKEGGLTETFDIIISGWELTSGAIRETNRSKIEKSMRLSGINTNDYNFYLSIIDKSTPHGGFGMGIDRLIAKILNLEIVSDAVVFPRTFKNLIP